MSFVPTVTDDSVEVEILAGLLPHQLADEIDAMTPVEWTALKAMFAVQESSSQARSVECVMRRLINRAIAKERDAFYSKLEV